MTGWRSQAPAGCCQRCLTPEEAATLAALGPRPQRGRLRAAILQLARRRAWKPRELADLLGRKDARRLVEDHPAPMVEAGILRRTEPDTPSHPEQAYTAVARAATRSPRTPRE